MADNITEHNVPEHQVTVPAHVEYPSVKFNPLYFIKDTDIVEVVVKLNGNVQKEWVYQPSIPIPVTEGRLFVAKLAIAETVIPTTP